MKASPLARHKVLYEYGHSGNPNTVSVLVSLYNYCGYIVECLDSVAAQDYSSLELIIVDDCSTDESVQTVIDWINVRKARFSRILFMLSTYNRGLAYARNLALQASSSDYVFIIDADNAIYPKAISKLMNAMLASGSSAAYSQLEFFGDVSSIGDADILRKSVLAKGNYVDAMALFDKTILLKLGGYKHVAGGWEDYDLWCKLLEQAYNAVFLPSILCRYRVHHNSMLRTETKNFSLNVTIQMLLRHPWLSLDS